MMRMGMAVAAWAMFAALTGCVEQVKYSALALEREGMVGSPAATEAPARASAPVLPVAAPPEAPAPANQRIIVYSGLIQLVVSDVARTLETVQAQAISAGGYLQEMDAQSITVRVPAARFQEVVASVSRLGELTQKQIRAQDVTEEMRDLKIRLENAVQSRQRLLALLEKSAKMEDMLKAEAELERITQTIELLKGKLQALSTQVSFSVLKVALNSPNVQRKPADRIPFAWVRQLGEGAVTGQSLSLPSRDRGAIRFEAPKSYIRYYEGKDLSEAMSADGMLIKVQKQENYRGGDLDFWSALARRVLVENRAVSLGHEETITIRNDVPARLMLGTRDVAGQKSGYLVVIAVRERNVYAFEAWGPLAAMEKDRAALEAAVRSLEAR